MADFLLELRSEEIPARMQAKARDDLARLFAAELAKAGLAAAETVTYATPRRLALIARGLPEATEAVREEVKGPKASAPAAGAGRLPAQDRPHPRSAGGARRRALRRHRAARPRHHRGAG